MMNTDPAVTEPKRRKKTRRGCRKGKPNPPSKRTPRIKPRRLRAQSQGYWRYWAAAKTWAKDNDQEALQPPIHAFFGKRFPYPCSNHAEVPFVYQGRRYPTSEHAYLALQARHYGLHDLHDIWADAEGEFIAYGQRFEAADPKSIKAWSTKVFREIKRNPNDQRVKDWNAKKARVMYSIVRAKFAGNTEARRALLATGSKFLLEASPYDKYWGAGINTYLGNYANLLENGRLPGRNQLGMILLAVRSACIRANITHRFLRKRTIAYHARRAARRNPQIPAEAEEGWVSTASHFALQLLPSVRPLVAKTYNKHVILPTKGAILPVVKRRSVKGRNKRLKGDH
jgi:ribA/ribD-fused uncharacterized protein